MTYTKLLSLEAVDALVLLAKRNFKDKDIPKLLQEGWWFDQYRSEQMYITKYFCFICSQDILLPQDYSNKMFFSNTVFDHGMMHLKEHKLLAFL